MAQLIFHMHTEEIHPVGEPASATAFVMSERSFRMAL